MKKLKRALAIMTVGVMMLGVIPAFNSQAETKTSNGKTVIDSINQNANGELISITDGYSTDETCVVLTARLKALNSLTHDWSKSVLVGVSGMDAWKNYAFQFVYGTRSDENLIKLNVNGETPMGYGTFDGIEVNQEQWYNNVKLEQLFEQDGIDIKLVRYNTWAYLLADMGEGYELIGTMGLPADAPTQFTLCNGNTKLRMSKITVETGEEAVLSELEGMSLKINPSAKYFPIGDSDWTLEGRLIADFDVLNPTSRIAMVGTNTWTETIAVTYHENKWNGEELNAWGMSNISNEHSTFLNAENGGLWVRWVCQENTLALYTSTDKETWAHVVDNRGINTGASGIYITSEFDFGSTLTDVRLSVNSEIPEIYEQPKNGMTIIPGNYEEEDYAVFDVTLKALEAVSYDWSKAVVLSVSGATAWGENTYPFQLVYGENSYQNLVKLISGYGDVDGVNILKEQWINSINLEKVFSENGMEFRIVRMKTWAYLLADMGAGYELIGKMNVPEDKPTQFAIYNGNTALQVSNLRLGFGKNVALSAMDGMSLKPDSPVYFPIDATNWTIEGKLMFDNSKLLADDSSRITYVGTNDWSEDISVIYMIDDQKWSGEGLSSWNYADIQDSQLLSIENGGLWVRWVREESKLSMYTSTDRSTWKHVLDNEGLHNDVDGIFIAGLDGSRLTNVSIRDGIGEDIWKDMGSDSIKITVQPEKTEYFVGDILDFTGMEVTLMNGNNEVKKLTLDECVINPNRKLTTEDTSVTVTYRDFSVVVPITVNERMVTKVELRDLPYQVTYKKGSDFNAAGATYLATYDNGDIVEYDITTAMCGPVDTSQSGDKMVTATVIYAGGSSKLNFIIEVQSDPVKYEPSVAQPTQGGGTDSTQLSQDNNNVVESTIQTGDTNNGAIYAMMILLSAACVMLLLKKNYHKE